MLVSVDFWKISSFEETLGRSFPGIQNWKFSFPGKGRKLEIYCREFAKINIL